MALASIFSLCNATKQQRDDIKEFDMNANSHEVKFTDDIEREMIQQEADEFSDSGGDPTRPLLKWIFVIAVSIGIMFIVVFAAR